ncbi:AAA family ATPase [Lewinella sp. JB7]|uniref:AAA family ATPase n=1 Tax=Lewinella sp. JB7 TaxID=2962887 RepID=UPI0020C9E80B|nr:MoxR family ATPase [Lewinella sp. JB7]MCP9235401.1 MoxR family ATPase [Lewinella sp. JB7]
MPNFHRSSGLITLHPRTRHPPNEFILETKHLPTGAEALLIALATPAPQGLTGIPVLLWGRPGVGKSSFIEGLAHEELRVTTLIASIHDPTDFSGLPVLEGGKVRYAVPEWVSDFAEVTDGILFLDELSTAPPSVQAALLRVVFERKVGFTPLPAGVRIVAAANPPDLMVGGWELSPPLRNRFVHLQWDIPEQLYLRSLTEGWERGVLPRIDAQEHARRLGEWKLRINGFLRLRPDSLHSDPDENRFGFASPRSWDFAAVLLCSCELLGYTLGQAADQRVVLDLVAGCLGEATAIPLVEYLANLRLPDPERVLAGTDAVDISSLDDAELYVFFYGLNAYLRQELDGDRLLPYSMVYLQLASEAFADGRRDIIFVPLKEMARAGWITRLSAAAGGAGPQVQGEVVEQIQRVFSDDAFSEFVDVLA